MSTAGRNNLAKSVRVLESWRDGYRGISGYENLIKAFDVVCAAAHRAEDMEAELRSVRRRPEPYWRSTIEGILRRTKGRK